MSDDFTEGHGVGNVINGYAMPRPMADQGHAPNTQIAQSYQRAMSFFAALGNVAPELKKFNFKEADEKAVEVTLSDGEKLFDSYEYQSAKRDFENLAKIRDLLKNCHFRTAKIEYDFRELGCGGYAFDELYQRLHDNALKNAVPVLMEAISSQNFEKAKVIADELLKTYDETDLKNYDRLIDLIKPDYHFVIREECYYVPIDIDAESENFYDKAIDAAEALGKIADAGDELEKTLAIVWLVDYQIFELMDYFADNVFLESEWFETLLDDSLADRKTDFRLLIKLLLTVRMPELARKVFEKSKKPKLTEEDYYEIVAEVAEELAGEIELIANNLPESTAGAAVPADLTKEEYYDDTI